MFQQQNTHVQLLLSLPLSLKHVLLYLVLHLLSHNWIINSGVTDHMIKNQGIMSSLIHESFSNFVVLADVSRTLIQGIGTVTITATLSLSSVFYLLCFLFNLLLVR